MAPKFTLFTKGSKLALNQGFQNRFLVTTVSRQALDLVNQYITTHMWVLYVYSILCGYVSYHVNILDIIIDCYFGKYNTEEHLSRPARKPTLWTPRKVSTRISLSMPRRLIRIYTFRLLWIFCFGNHYSIPLRRNVSARISLRGLHRLIWVDTLRRFHNDGFLFERLKCNVVLVNLTESHAQTYI